MSGTEPTFTAICNTGVGANTDTGIAAAYSGPAGANTSDTVTMHVVHELAAPGTAAIRCSTPRSGSWGDATLTAVQIG